MKELVIIKDEEGGYNRLSESVKLIIEYTKSAEIDWTEIRVIKGKGWKIYHLDEGDWVLYSDDPCLLMYVKLKL